MAKYTQEERNNMVEFVKRTFGDKVRDDELVTDAQIEKLYNEAHNYSDWGL